jgi:hypothetical protein
LRIYLGTSSSLHLKLIKKSPYQTSPRRGGFNISIIIVISHSPPYGGSGERL